MGHHYKELFEDVEHLTHLYDEFNKDTTSRQVHQERLNNLLSFIGELKRHQNF